MFRTQYRGSDDYWPFPKPAKTILQKGLGPQDSDVSFIINNRPFCTNDAESGEITSIKAKLNESLTIARQTVTDTSPVVVATKPITSIQTVQLALAKAANPNLSISVSGDEVNVFYKPPGGFRVSTNVLQQALQCMAVVDFKQRNYYDAQKSLEESIGIQKSYDPASVELAQSLDFLGLLYRCDGTFDKAESAYLQSLSIKQKALSDADPALAASYMNLADLYYDKGDSERANKLRQKAEHLMSENGIKIADRPVPTSIYPATFQTLPMISATSSGVIDGYKNHKASTQGEIDAVRALMKSLMPDDNSYVYGTAQCPLDRTNSLVFNKSITEAPQGGKTEKEQHRGKSEISDVRDFPVVLCSARVQPEIDSLISQYAQKYGFARFDYLKTWPGIREQAKELILDMVPVVNRLSPRIEETNDHGEFEMKDVPKGDYYLFGYLVTSSVAMYWLQHVPINSRVPFRVDFLRDNAVILWEKNKIAPSVKPQMASDEMVAQNETKPANKFVQPPPPEIPRYFAPPPIYKWQKK